jgi:hypothetical protein
VSGNNASRVFEVTGGVNVTLGGLKIAHGMAATGGGIDNAGNLTVKDCTLADNQAVGGLGGGILNEAGACLALVRSLLTGNQATAGLSR